VHEQGLALGVAQEIMKHETCLALWGNEWGNKGKYVPRIARHWEEGCREQEREEREKEREREREERESEREIPLVRKNHGRLGYII